MPNIPDPHQKLPGTDYVICENGKCIKKDSGKDPLKKHCVPKPDEQCKPNKPNDPDDKYKCHCRAFKWIPDQKDPKKGKWEDQGTGDFEDDENIYCFCVRLPRR
jgi:hypothetical protein